MAKEEGKDCQSNVCDEEQEIEEFDVEKKRGRCHLLRCHRKECRKIWKVFDGGAIVFGELKCKNDNDASLDAAPLARQRRERNDDDGGGDCCGITVHVCFSS